MNKTELNMEIRNLLEQYEYADDCNYTPTEYGVGRMLDVWERQNAPLLDIFKRSRYYNGRYQIVLTEDFNREFDKEEANAFLSNFASDLRNINNKYIREYDFAELKVGDIVADETGYWIVNTEIDRWGELRVSRSENEYGRWVNRQYVVKIDENGNPAEKKFEFPVNPTGLGYIGSGEICMTYFDEETAEMMNKYFPFLRVHVGQKVNKVILKLSRKYGLNLATTWESRYARFSDALTPMKVTRYTILSINPVDYLTMSFGHNWASCHSVDKTGLREGSEDNYSGQWSGGTESYMLDSTSFVVYTVDKSYTGNEFELEDKIERQMFHWGEGKLIQGRLYPQDNDTGSKEKYKQLREIVQRVFAEALGVPNYWKNVKGTAECSSMTISKGVHYRDYKCFENCNVSYLKTGEIDDNGNDVLNRNKIVIGYDDMICPSCGCIHHTQDCIECGECQDVHYCYECGDVIRGDSDDAIEIDGDWFCCSYCAERAGYVYCENADRWAYSDNGNVYYDDYTDEYFYNDGWYYNGMVTTEDGRYFMNEDHAEWAGYKETENGRWYPEDEVIECPECGEMVHVDDFNEELNCCNDCAEKKEVA